LESRPSRPRGKSVHGLDELYNRIIKGEKGPEKAYKTRAIPIKSVKKEGTGVLVGNMLLWGKVRGCFKRGGGKGEKGPHLPEKNAKGLVRSYHVNTPEKKNCG